MRKIVAITAIAWLAICGAASAQEVMKCEKEQVALDAVNRKYELAYAALENNPPRDPGSNSVSVGSDVSFTSKTISFNLPESTMKQRGFSFNTAKTTMKSREMIFKKPVTRMVNKPFGSRPTIKCNWKGCTTKMETMYTKVPEITMEEVRVVTNVPEFKWERTEISFSVPEFTMKRREMTFKYPEIKGQPTDSGTERQREFDAISEAHKKEAAPLIDALFQCQQQSLIDVRKDVAAQFDQGIQYLTGAITGIQQSGGDPSSVPGEGGPQNLLAERERLIEQRNASLAEIDKAIQDITNVLVDTLRAYGFQES